MYNLEGSTMIQCETTTRKWGNSLGITLPKDLVEKNKIKANQKVEVLILKRNKNVWDGVFGSAEGKLPKNTQKALSELRKELYND